MTIATSANQATYTGDGVSVAFAFPYPFIAPADLKVYVGGVLQVAGYSITGTVAAGGSGAFGSGVVTFLIAPAVLQVLIYCDPDLLQSTSLPPNDPFPSKTVEKMADKLTLLIQRVSAKVINALRAPEGETGSALIVGSAAARAGTLVGFDALGNYAPVALQAPGIFTYGQTVIDKFTGNGAQTVFTLSANPGAQSNIEVIVGGVEQYSDDDFVWAGGVTLTFTAPPPAVAIRVKYTRSLPIGASDAGSTAFDPAGTYGPLTIGGWARAVQNSRQVSVFDYMTVAQIADVQSYAATIDCAAAFQAAVNASDRVYFPSGGYRINSTIARSSQRSIMLIGSGEGGTYLVKYGDGDLFNLTIAAGADGQVLVENMTITTGTDMATGAAINVTGNPHTPSVSFRNIFITQGTLDFKYGIKLNNCAEAQLTNVVAFSSKPNSTMSAVYVTCSRTAPASGPLKFIQCSAYGVQYGAQIISTTNVGIEGVQFYGCDYVCTNGVRISDGTGGYLPPQVTIIGGHMNCVGYNVYIDSAQQINIQGVLFYNTGSSAVIALKNSNFYTIKGNQFYGDLGGDPTGVDLNLSGTSVCGNGIIEGNIFALKSAAPTKYCIDIGAATTTLDIKNNLRPSGAVGMLTGTLNSGIVMRGNTLDSSDYYQTMATAATLDVSTKRSTFINLTSVGAVTVTAITQRQADDVFTFQANDANTTFQHNASIHMKGGINYNVAAGGTVTLRAAGANGWYETGRA